MKRALLLFIMVVSCVSQELCAQKVGLKTNLAADFALNPNIGLEVGLAPKWTLEVDGQFNAWTLSNDKRWKHWAVQPGVRYWLCDRFGGSYFGAYLHGGQYNVGGINLNVNFLGTDFRKLKDTRYQGVVRRRRCVIRLRFCTWPALEFGNGNRYRLFLYPLRPFPVCRMRKED